MSVIVVKSPDVQVNVTQESGITTVIEDSPDLKVNVAESAPDIIAVVEDSPNSIIDVTESAPDIVAVVQSPTIQVVDILGGIKGDKGDSIESTWVGMVTGATNIELDPQQPMSGEVFKYIYTNAEIRFRFIDSGVDEFYTGWDGTVLFDKVTDRFLEI